MIVPKNPRENQPHRELLMKNIILYMTFVSLIAPVRADGLQLFGSKKSSEKDRGNKSEELRNNDEMTEDYSSTEVTTRKNIESVIPV